MEKSCFAFYNVENFYEPYQHISSEKPIFNKKWNQARYELKLKKISKTLEKIGFEYTNNAPEIIGLAEIQSSKILIDLIQQENLLKYNYDYIFFNSKETRSMNVGFLYQKNKIQILETKNKPIKLQDSESKNYYSRDILYVKIQIKQQIIHYFTVHLPSQRLNNLNATNRKLVLEILKEWIYELNQKYENPKICIAGDFNENPTSYFLQQTFGDFHQPFLELYSQKKYSLRHQNQGFLFDQFLFSTSFFEDNFIKNDFFCGVYNAIDLCDANSKNFLEPFRTHIGTRYLGGSSDHFPIYTILKID